MRLLLVSTVYPPVIGGPAAQTQEIASAMSRRGHTVTVLATSEFAESSNEFEVVHWPARRRPFDRVFRNLRLLRDLNGLMERVSPELVHMQTCEGNVAFAVGSVARVHGVPRLVKFSSDAVWSRLNRDRHLGVPYQDIHDTSLGARLLTQAQRATLAQYNLVWATSPFQQQALAKTYGVRPEAIHALPNLVRVPAQVKASARTAGELRALLVARLVPTKGIETAIRALQALPDRPWRLRIVGEGEPKYETSLRNLARDLRVQPRVDFVGAISPAKLSDEYEAADVLLLPSWYEAFGIVLVQAMAAGVPCVASNVGGIPSVVRDGETGVLFPPGDSGALAAALRQFEDASLRQQFGERGRTEARRFDLETRFDDLFAMYQRTLALARG